MYDSESGVGLGHGHGSRNPTVGQFLGDGPFVSKPGADNTDHALQQLTDMMGRLGAQIGDSIMANTLSVIGSSSSNLN